MDLDNNRWAGPFDEMCFKALLILCAASLVVMFPGMRFSAFMNPGLWYAYRYY